MRHRQLAAEGLVLDAAGNAPRVLAVGDEAVDVVNRDLAVDRELLCGWVRSARLGLGGAERDRPLHRLPEREAAHAVFSSSSTISGKTSRLASLPMKTSRWL